MRTYIGSTDPSTGHQNVSIAEQGERLDLTTVGYVLDRLDDIAERRRADPNFTDPLRTAMLLDQEHAALQRLKAAEITNRPLHHEPIHSPNGFAWGYAGNGPADLAHAILRHELGDSVPPDVYLPFRDAVVAQLPRDAFELPATEVWDWIRHQRHLVDHHLFGVEPPPTPAVAPEHPSRTHAPSEPEPSGLGR